MKSKKTKMNPATALRKMQEAKMGKSVGSMLEGGSIKYKNGGPKFPKKGSKTLGIFGGTMAGEILQAMIAGDAMELRKDRVAERDKLIDDAKKKGIELSKRDAMKQARKNITN